jgi:hypothetical protein
LLVSAVLKKTLLVFVLEISNCLSLYQKHSPYFSLHAQRIVSKRKGTSAQGISAGAEPEIIS